MVTVAEIRIAFPWWAAPVGWLATYLLNRDVGSVDFMQEVDLAEPTEPAQWVDRRAPVCHWHTTLTDEN